MVPEKSARRCNGVTDRYVAAVNIARNLLLSTLLVLVSCSPDTSPAPAPTPPPGTEAATAAMPQTLATPGAEAPVPNADRQQPLRGLGPCHDAPAEGHDDDVEGLVLPPDAIVTKVSPAGPLTNVQGYLPLTPIEVRAFYQLHNDVTIISVEDEVFESEVLFEAGDRRVFVKSQAVCERGSVFVGVVAPAES